MITSDDLAMMIDEFTETDWVRFSINAVGVALPEDWPTQLRNTVAEHGLDVQKKGRGPGSLEADATAGLDYRVLDGDAVREHAPWLWEMYRNPRMAEFVSVIVGCPVETREGPDAINVNYLRGQKRYEWHIDSDPFTVLLYATRCDAATGGGLLLAPLESPENIAVYPEVGDCVLFNGLTIPHAVQQLVSEDAERVSAPMVYYATGVATQHDHAVSSYLYAR